MALRGKLVHVQYQYSSLLYLWWWLVLNIEEFCCFPTFRWHAWHYFNVKKCLHWYFFKMSQNGFSVAISGRSASVPCERRVIFYPLPEFFLLYCMLFLAGYFECELNEYISLVSVSEALMIMIDRKTFEWKIVNLIIILS